MVKSNERVITINLKNAWREMIIIALFITVLFLTGAFVNQVEFKPIPVESYQAGFYDCVESCYYEFNAFNPYTEDVI